MLIVQTASCSVTGRLGQRMAACLLAILLIGTNALAQQPGDELDDSQVLAELNHEAYAARQKMTEQLLQDDHLSLDRLADWYQQAQSPEQRHRLRLVARHHLLRQIAGELFLDGHRGSLGLRLEGVSRQQTPRLNQAAARVVQTYPGFPAYAWLREGDLIVAVMDEPLPDGGHSSDIRDHFIRQIASHGPGQMIQLRVWRDGQMQDVRFALANYDALENLYDIHTSRLHRPYQQRWDQLFDQMRQDEPAPRRLEVQWPAEQQQSSQ